MPSELALPKTFGPAQAVAWFASWSAVANEPELTLSLPAGAFLRPTGIALLAAGIAERQRLGKKTSLLAEAGAEDAFRYLQRIDFFSALGVSTKENLTRDDLAFVPLRRITDERVARELATANADRLAKQTELGSTLLRMARYLFEELGAYVAGHSESPDTRFGLMESFSDDLEIAFADRGIGFLASLQKNPELAGRIDDEGEALQLALGKGMSGTSAPRRNMGMGLGLLQDFADRLGGELWIASGSATLRRRTVAGVRSTTVHANGAWPGSWICLESATKPG